MNFRIFIFFENSESWILNHIRSEVKKDSNKVKVDNRKIIKNSDFDVCSESTKKGRKRYKTDKNLRADTADFFSEVKEK